MLLFPPSLPIPLSLPLPPPSLSPSLSLSLPPFSLSQFDVHEKQEVVGKDQWKELEEEEEEEEVIEESDEETEGGFTETESDWPTSNDIIICIIMLFSGSFNAPNMFLHE